MKKLILTLIFCLVWSVAFAGMNGYLAAAAAKKRIADVNPGFIGNDSTSASDGNQVMASGNAYFSDLTTTTAGTIGYIHVWIAGVAVDDELIVGIYNSGGSTKLVESNVVTISSVAGDNVYDFELDSTIQIEEATTYRVVVAVNSGSISAGLYYVTYGTPYSGRNIAITITDGSLPLTLTNSAGNYWRYVMWGDNTSGH